MSGVLKYLPIFFPILMQPPFSSQQLTVACSFATRVQGWLSRLPKYLGQISFTYLPASAEPRGLFGLGQACK